MVEMIEQEDESQCQDCGWWGRRPAGSNTCLPRVATYITVPINKTAEAAHKSTFNECPYKEEEK